MLSLPVLVFSVVAHEYAHGVVALSQGDPTAARLGRLTLNPVPHTDLWLTILLPTLLWFGSGGQFTFGGAKPVPVDPRNFRDPRWSDVLVSAAGVVTNALLALAAALVFVIVGLVARAWPDAAPAADVVQRMMTWGIWLNLMLAVFNLIPVPPLDGSHLLFHLLPARIGTAYRRFARFGVIPLLVLMVFFPGGISVLLSPARWGASRLLELVVPFAAGTGWNIFG